MKTTKAINLRVARGTRYLDRHCPGWANNIDLATLDMESGAQCVLGQCFGDFFRALQTHTPIKVQGMDTESQNEWAIRHGFYGDGKPGAYERLGLSWAPVIAYRQMQERFKTVVPSED